MDGSLLDIVIFLIATFAGGHFNIDQFRHAIERMNPAHYLDCGTDIRRYRRRRELHRRLFWNLGDAEVPVRYPPRQGWIGLAGLPQNPPRINPRRHPDRVDSLALNRRQLGLETKSTHLSRHEGGQLALARRLGIALVAHHAAKEGEAAASADAALSNARRDSVRSMYLRQ